MLSRRNLQATQDAGAGDYSLVLLAGLHDGSRAAYCSQPALTSNTFQILKVDLQIVALTCEVSRKVWDLVTFSCWNISTAETRARLGGKLG